jgi:hypothetical protein
MESDQLWFWYVYSMATFGLFGAALARRWNRNPIAWGLSAALLTLPAIAALFLLGKGRSLAGRACPNAWRYWEALKLVDPDAAKAGEEAKSLDKEDALAELMFELRDPQRVASALAAISHGARPAKPGWSSTHG